MTPLTCIDCERELTPEGSAENLLICEACRSEFLRPGSRSVLVPGGVGDSAGHRDLQLPPAFLERYGCTKVLGRGAAGTVYRARDHSENREVAIKFLTRMADPSMRDRFEREGRIGASIDHENVVRVLETGVIGEHPFHVSEYVEGGDLADWIRDGAPAQASEAVRIVLDVLAGLEACHGRGVVHRDLKPSNILLTPEGRAKIADLGLARDYSEAGLTRPGEVIGTPLYMAPELIGEGPQIASDLYSVGIILHELLTGKPPFTGPNIGVILKGHLETPPPPVPGENLNRVLSRALAKHPADRPTAAADLAVALRRAVDLPVPTPPRATRKSLVVPRSSSPFEGAGAPPTLKHKQSDLRPGKKPSRPATLPTGTPPTGTPTTGTSATGTGKASGTHPLGRILLWVYRGFLVVVFAILLQMTRAMQERRGAGGGGTPRASVAPTPDRSEEVLDLARRLPTDPTTAATFGTRLHLLNAWLTGVDPTRRPFRHGLLSSLERDARLGETYVHKKLDGLYGLAEVRILQENPR